MGSGAGPLGPLLPVLGVGAGSPFHGPAWCLRSSLFRTEEAGGFFGSAWWFCAVARKEKSWGKPQVLVFVSHLASAQTDVPKVAPRYMERKTNTSVTHLSWAHCGDSILCGPRPFEAWWFMLPFLECWNTSPYPPNHRAPNHQSEAEIGLAWWDLNLEFWRDGKPTQAPCCCFQVFAPGQVFWGLCVVVYCVS